MTARSKRIELVTKRVYEPASDDDGKRILIDRLWPRGLSREKARIDYWAKDAAPSDALRKWYQHDPEKWERFRERYFAELDARPEAVDALRAELVPGRNSIVFGSRERDLNNARALVEYLEAR
ncbi:MAG: DUF488 family protein [bacterium]|nr:DUF488 family protein [bacterium]